MCGILGIFHHSQAFSQVQRGLSILEHRGRDGCGVSDGKLVYHARSLDGLKAVSSDCVIGHVLHAVVDEVAQPLRGKGVVVANCEIYNWQSLNKKYGFKSKNDAEFLLQFLDSFFVRDNVSGFNKIEELDGVYAFAYWSNGKVVLVRDILGEKPIWYTYTRDVFAFASEKKVLEQLGYVDICELNPRQILIYDVKEKTLNIIIRSFLTSLPEHKDSFEVIKTKTAALLDEGIEKRIPRQKFGLLFSGGIDSTFLAHYFKSKGYDFTCYTAGLDLPGSVASDVVAAEKVAKELGLKLKIKKIKLEEVEKYLKKIVPLIEDSNVVKVGVALPFYLACEMAKKDGCKVIFSGLGSEEIFAGYERHKLAVNINKECIFGLLKMYERDLYRDDVVTMSHSLELRLPFLDRKLADYALKIPAKYKLTETTSKYILRQIAMERGISTEIANRQKVAAQYGSKFDAAIEKLAKLGKYASKSAYLKTFYPSHNVRLGVLFSGGKDSMYAAYIMKQQNYELTCLITLKSKNLASYMFHTPAIDLTKLQAEALGLPILTYTTDGEKEKELLDLEAALRLAQKQYGIQGVVTGAVFSTYQRDRIEKIADTLGLKIFSPLWHKPQEQEMQELLQKKFKIVLTAIAAEGFDKSWLGKVITEKELGLLQKLKVKYGININGEGGEYESLVLDCPLFTKELVLDTVEIVEEKKNTAQLMIHKASLQEKSLSNKSKSNSMSK